VLVLLNQLDGRKDVAAGPFAVIVGRLADKAADLALDACLLLAAKGIWHLAVAVRARRRAREPERLAGEVLGLPAGGPDDGAAELAALTQWIDGQDQAMIATAADPAPLAEPAEPEEARLLAMGRRMFERMRAAMRDAICAEKGIPRKLAGDTTKEVAEQLRKALGRGEVSTAGSLALAGLAAAVARLGFERFCSADAKVVA
jgi:hypothetical protein